MRTNYGEILHLLSPRVYTIISLKEKQAIRAVVRSWGIYLSSELLVEWVSHQFLIEILVSKY